MATIVDPRLLTALLSGGQTTPAPAPQQGDPAPVQQAPGPIPAATPAPINPSASADPDLAITGWKPHHATTLGHIADYALAAMGLPIMPFAKKAKKENMQEMMEGFTDDPVGTIRKMARIPGMEQKAFQLFEQYQSLHKNDEESDQKIQYYKDMNSDRSRSVLSSYIGGIKNSKDPEANYQKMLPTLRAFAANRQLPSELLPDKWDPDMADTALFAGIKPETQVSLGEKARYDQSQIGVRTRQVQSLEDYRKARLGQLDRAETDRNTRFDEGQDRQDHRKMMGKPTTLPTKYGPAEVSPDGNFLKVTVGDNHHIYRKTGPDQWRLIK